MKLIQARLKKENKKTIFLNLDYEEDKKYFDSQKKLVDKLKLEFGGEKAFVFIDEIQRKENAGLFLKGIYDLDLPYKFIVSGSGSLELKEKIHESLAGRKIFFEMFPLSFDEFVNFRTGYAYEKKLSVFLETEKQAALDFLREYMNFGGYPKCVLSEKESEKKLQIDEIYKSYVEKDISYWLKVDKVYAFRDLIKHLSFHAGKIMNYSETASALNISLPTLKNYVYYAEKTFIISEIRPYFKNPLKELVKAPAIYFGDTGLKNYVSGSYGSAADSPGNGFLFQNLVFNVLRQKTAFTPYRINYWRTKDGAEVDFILDKNSELVPVEVKYSRLKESKTPGSLVSFIKRYAPARAYVVNLSLEQKVKINGTEVFFIPFFKFLSEEI